YLVNGQDMYILLAGGDRFEPDTPDVVKFFDSFQLLGQKPAQRAEEKRPPPPQQPQWKPLPPPAVENPPLPLVATLKGIPSDTYTHGLAFLPGGDRLVVGREVYARDGWMKETSLSGSHSAVVALAPDGKTAAVAGIAGTLE